MPYNGSGSFSIVNTFLPNTTILSAAVNQNLTDIAAGLSDALTRDGQAGMTADLAMGTHKITGMGTPSASTDATTKGYVDTLFASAWSTGDVKLTVKIVADTGWLLFADQTIGNVGSGATYANVAALDLYTLLWNNISSPTANVYAPVTGGLGASAAADWAGLKSMLLLKTLGRAMAIGGAGSGLTSRVLGSNTGVESEATTLAQLPTGITSTGTVTVTVVGSQTFPAVAAGNTVTGVPISVGSGTTWVPIVVSGSEPWGGQNTSSGSNTLTSNNTSGTTHSLMQPSTFLNAMIKL